MMIRKTILALLAGAALCTTLAAQDIVVPSGYTIVDSIVYRPTDAADKTLEGKSILTDMSGATVRQDASVETGLSMHISRNRSKALSGYRVRIFFDNKQDSRSASETALRRFQAEFPGVSAYRSFTNPFFKVTVGDFRTRSEATKMLQAVKNIFPSAFVVKEQIKYPVVDKDNAYIIDTVRVLRSLSPSESL